MAVESPSGELGMLAPDFSLPGTDGKTWSKADLIGPSGLVVVFMCNHCPYVLAVIDRIVGDFAELRRLGYGVVGISANDVVQYPEDSFEAMGNFARTHGIDFPYLYDESQEVARAYGAVCTPDFFGFDAGQALRYRGRLDSSGRQPAAPDVRRELVEAMTLVRTTGAGPDAQSPAIGCSIKWRQES